jgi:predicted AAA+ superfamily ATPase
MTHSLSLPTDLREYRHRVVDRELDAYLPQLPAVALDGPKAVGKTQTARRRAATMFRLDLTPERQIVEADLARAVRAAPPVLFDEWQRLPEVWDAVRRAVDEGAPPGQFLLTGSAAPETPPTHSGAGRIVSLRMRPLSLAERGLGAPTVSLHTLMSGARAPVVGTTPVTLADYASEIVRSGFPGMRALRGPALRRQLDGYLQRVVDRDIKDAGLAVRKPDALRRWMAAYAAATSTVTSFEKIRKAAAAGGAPVASEDAAAGYREALGRLFLLDAIPGWMPTRNAFARLMQAPRHHLADPALAARLLSVDEGALLAGTTSPLFDETMHGTATSAPRDGTLFGQLFESLVTQSVLVYAQAGEATVRHLRTFNGRHEVDLIVERDDRRVVGIEVKLSAVIDDDDVKHLHWLRTQLGDDLLDMVVLTTGAQAYRRPDGIAVVPAALLGP